MSDEAGLRQITKEEWIDALFYGGYRQNVGNLRSPEGNSYCCLGVLADLAGVEWHGQHFVWPLAEQKCEHVNYLSRRFCRAIGLDWLSASVQDELAQLNDRQGKSFREIGEYLKELPH